MKATLEFNLPEDREEYTLTSRAISLYCAVSEFDSWLRDKIKYEDLNDNDFALIDVVRRQLHEFLTDHGVEI